MVTPWNSTMTRGVRTPWVRSSKRHSLEIANHRFGFLASMRLDECSNDINAFSFQLMRIFEHLISLSHACRGADVNAQAGPFALF